MRIFDARYPRYWKESDAKVVEQKAQRFVHLQPQPTAEQIFRKHPLMSVRSAGTSPNSRHKVSADDIRWTNVIFVMEEKHKSRLVADFSRWLDGKSIHVLDIPDEYKYMDPELVEQLEQSVSAILGFD